MAIKIHLVHVVFYCASLISATYVEKFGAPARKFKEIKENFAAIKNGERSKAFAHDHLAPDRNIREETRGLSSGGSFYYETEYIDEECETAFFYTAQPLGTCLYESYEFECASSTLTQNWYDGSDCAGTPIMTDSHELETGCPEGFTETCGEAPSNIVGEMTFHLFSATCESDPFMAMAFAGGCQDGEDDGSAVSMEISCDDSGITMNMYMGSSCAGDVEHSENMVEMMMMGMYSYSYMPDLTESYSYSYMPDLNESCVGLDFMSFDVSCTPSFFVNEAEEEDDAPVPAPTIMPEEEDDAPVPAPTIMPEEEDDAPCFSGDDVLTTPGGSVRLSEVKVGDRVLSATKTGNLSFSDVVFLPHETNQKRATFVEMTTNGNKQLHATKGHLMVTCEGETAAAGSLTPGVCLRTVDGDETLKMIKLVQKHGIYTAVTESDYLVVGGVVASPFAINHDLVHAYYNIHRFVYNVFPALLKSTLVARANDWLGHFSATVYGSLFLGKE